jgi:hypothetical protein
VLPAEGRAVQSPQGRVCLELLVKGKGQCGWAE